MRMPRHSGRAVAAVALVAAGVAARPLAPGYTYTYRATTTVTDKSGGAKTTSAVLARGQTSGTMARMDFDESKGSPIPGQEKGGYMIFDGKTGDWTMVSTKDKQYMTFNVANLGQFLGGAMQMVSAMVKVDLSDVNISSQPGGSCGTIEGHATQKVTTTESYTMSMSMMGQHSVQKVNGTSEYCLAPDLKEVVNPYMEFGRKFMASMGNSGGMKDLFDKLEENQKEVFARGFPVKVTINQVTTDEKGKTQTTHTEQVMESIKKGDVPASVFQVPADYKKMEMPNAGNMPSSSGDAGAAAPAASGTTPPPDLGKSIDSAKSGMGDAVKKGAEAGAKDATKEAIKKKLGGIFKRP